MIAVLSSLPQGAYGGSLWANIFSQQAKIFPSTWLYMCLCGYRNKRDPEAEPWDASAIIGILFSRKMSKPVYFLLIILEQKNKISSLELD